MKLFAGKLDKLAEELLDLLCENLSYSVYKLVFISMCSGCVCSVNTHTLQHGQNGLWVEWCSVETLIVGKC